MSRGRRGGVRGLAWSRRYIYTRTRTPAGKQCQHLPGRASHLSPSPFEHTNLCNHILAQSGDNSYMSVFLEMHTWVSVCLDTCLQVCLFVVCSRLASKVVHKYVSVHAITPQVIEPVFGARSEMPSSVSVCPNISSQHPCYLLRRRASSSFGSGLRHCKLVLSLPAIVTRVGWDGR